ncbi:MAG: alpha/beta hydrolase [Acidobacteria bacterium]|nr:MAG: alpha/beta hydrolase [Acidobacteriota bacterium]
MRIAAAVVILLTSPALADEVTLQTPTGTLYGTLLVPPARATLAVVLIIAGSGPTDRDGNSALEQAPNNSYRMLAEALAALDIASLQYDKRGVAASAAAFTSDMTIETEISDAIGWLQQLRSDPRFSLLIVAGHSEGSLIGIIAAERMPVDRVISLAGAGRPAGDVILSQIEAQFTPALIDAARKIVASLNAGVTVPNSMVPFGLRFIFDESGQPYLISWFRYDPAVEIGRLMIPVLIVQGTADTQVTIDDAMRLSNANRVAELQIITGMNHELKDASDPTSPIDRILVATVTSFIQPPVRRRAVR